MYDNNATKNDYTIRIFKSEFEKIVSSVYFFSPKREGIYLGWAFNRVTAFVKYTKFYPDTFIILWYQTYML